MHGIEHWTHYYTDYGVDLQKRFFGHFLKGEKNGWNKTGTARYLGLPLSTLKFKIDRLGLRELQKTIQGG